MADLIRKNKQIEYSWTTTGDYSEIDVCMCGVAVIIVNVYVLLFFFIVIIVNVIIIIIIIILLLLLLLLLWSHLASCLKKS